MPAPSRIWKEKLPPILLARLELEFQGEVVCSLSLANAADKVVRIETALDWEKWLDQQGIKTKRHRRIITEGALMGGLLAQGIPVTLSIVSDDAGQFNVFDHALCWIHAERIINRLIPLNLKKSVKFNPAENIQHKLDRPAGGKSCI